MSHVRVWSFQPASGRESEFSAAYSGDGVWAKLFRQAEGFVGTRLLAPPDAGGRWLTLDEWQSRDAFERFQATLGETYRGLDEELAGLTSDEQFIGAFEG